MEIGVITNPNSRKNRNKPNRARDLQSIVGSVGEVYQTKSTACIKPILRDFLRRRARYWVADGGDGALHWMLRNGFEVLEEDEFKGRGFALPLSVPSGGGTINFVTSNVGISGRAEQILVALRGAVESGTRIEEVEVDSMLIEAVERTHNGDESFRTYGFAVAAGGVGQRFYSKYYADADPNPRTIVKVLGRTLASMPVSMSPLRHLPGMPDVLKQYAREVFDPCEARVTVDGVPMPHDKFTGIHVASMSLNLGGVFKLFPKADTPGRLHCLAGAPSPMVIAKNIPNMHLGKELKGTGIVDRPCQKMTVEATGNELLKPIIDGEYYDNLTSMSFSVGPRVRIPKVVG